MNKQILILSASAGIGHTRAAEALKAEAETSFPDCSVIHIDILDVAPLWYKHVYSGSYVGMVKHYPLLWSLLYHTTDRATGHGLIDFIRRTIEHALVHRLKYILKEINPDIVICTHFMCAQIMSYYKKKGVFTKNVWVCITDFDCHWFWIHTYITGYCVGNEEIKNRLIGRGIDEQTIQVTGLPIMPVFNQSYSRQHIQNTLGIASDRFTILMMSGGFGILQNDTIAEKILSMDNTCRLIVITGKNEKLLSKIRLLADKYPERVIPVGFTTTIEQYMVCSDVAITKSGGMSVCECLAMGLPMIIYKPIAGQEERNADFIVEQGAGLKAYDEASLLYKVRTLTQDRQKLALMKKNALRISQPRSAYNVLRHILSI